MNSKGKEVFRAKYKNNEQGDLIVNIYIFL